MNKEEPQRRPCKIAEFEQSRDVTSESSEIVNYGI